ncbi:MAG: type IV toxin-antitoxin system AbiEi family antitoxin domain-containing protein [Elusimicrobiales bacterium]
MSNSLHSYKETFERLFTIAEGQGCYFTPKQAEAAGFSRKNHSYHVQMGNWIRERRGIYRLAKFSPTERPVLDLDAAPYGGARFPVEALVDDRIFVRFHLDVGAGDVILEPFDTTQAHDWLEFASIPGACGLPADLGAAFKTLNSFYSSLPA